MPIGVQTAPTSSVVLFVINADKPSRKRSHAANLRLSNRRGERARNTHLIFSVLVKAGTGQLSSSSWGGSLFDPNRAHPSPLASVNLRHRPAGIHSVHFEMTRSIITPDGQVLEDSAQKVCDWYPAKTANLFSATRGNFATSLAIVGSVAPKEPSRLR